MMFSKQLMAGGKQDTSDTEHKLRQDKVHRISVSLPKSLTVKLDEIVAEGHYRNRSQAITQMVRNNLLDQQYLRRGSQVMAGTVTLVYDESRPRLRERLIHIQRSHIDTVISSLNVLLENQHSLEVLQVQGPVDTLNAIVQQIKACKGVESCKLALTTIIMPPIHKKEDEEHGEY